MFAIVVINHHFGGLDYFFRFLSRHFIHIFVVLSKIVLTRFLYDSKIFAEMLNLSFRPIYGDQRCSIRLQILACFGINALQ